MKRYRTWEKSGHEGGQEKNVDVMKRTGKQKTVEVITRNENHHFLNKKLI